MFPALRSEIPLQPNADVRFQWANGRGGKRRRERKEYRLRREGPKRDIGNFFIRVIGWRLSILVFKGDGGSSRMDS
jgi:hypothetical protein